MDSKGNRRDFLYSKTVATLINQFLNTRHRGLLNVDSGVEGKISYLEESITTYLKVQIFERKTEAFKATHNLALDISKSEKLFSRIATKFKAELQNKIHYIIKNQDLLGSNHFFYPDSYRRYIQDT